MPLFSSLSHPYFTKILRWRSHMKWFKCILYFSHAGLELMLRPWEFVLTFHNHSLFIFYKMSRLFFLCIVGIKTENFVCKYLFTRQFALDLFFETSWRKVMEHRRAWFWNTDCQSSAEEEEWDNTESRQHAIHWPKSWFVTL